MKLEELKKYGNASSATTKRPAAAMSTRDASPKPQMKKKAVGQQANTLDCYFSKPHS